MKLLTEEIKKLLPALGATAEQEDPVAQVKFFDPSGSWTWFAVEFDPVEEIFFGAVDGTFWELGNFTLADLEDYKGRFTLGIERDLYWKPRPISQCKGS